MKIEEVSSDEATLIDESKLWKKRIKVKLVYNANSSFTCFNQDEEIYEIHLASEDKLLHEAHHLYIPSLRALHIASFMLHDTPKSLKDPEIVKSLEEIFKGLFLGKNKELETLSLVFHLTFLKAIERAGFLNSFEDLAIQEHLDKIHNVVEGDLYILTRNFLEKISRNVRPFFLVYNPFTTKEFFNFFLLAYDKEIAKEIAFKYRIPFEECFEKYYRGYLTIMKDVKKKVPRKDFAQRYRINLEIKRVKKLLKCGDWDKAESLVSEELQKVRKFAILIIKQ